MPIVVFVTGPRQIATTLVPGSRIRDKIYQNLGVAVTKYKPAHTPHLLEQKTEGGSTRASQVAKAASETVAHTRELLNQSRELIARARKKVSQLQAAPERQSARAPERQSVKSPSIAVRNALPSK